MLIVIFLLGLLFGSFINAAVWRIHEQKPLLKDRSQCPKCGHKLGAWDLIPIVSWLMLRARCRYCGRPISAWYPAVELLTGALFVWSYLAWDFNGWLSHANFGLWLGILIGLIILAVYDLRWMILPNRVIYPLLALALVNLGFGVAQNGLMDAASRLFAATVGGLFFFGLYGFSRGRWIGGGDAKLAILIGLTLGSARSLVAMFLGFNLAALVSLSLIATHTLTRKDLIPFGPFLIVATIFSMLHGPQLITAYINLLVY